jgi:LuxR family maltose regulon positive regulatory protein
LERLHWRANDLSGNQPVAWLSLDEGDGDLKRFLSYLITALQTLAPEIGVSVLNALPLLRIC